MTLAKAVQELRDDPDFCRSFRRGIGLVLAAFVVSQVVGCLFYPLIVQSWAAPNQDPHHQTMPTFTPTPMFVYLPVLLRNFIPYNPLTPPVRPTNIPTATVTVTPHCSCHPHPGISTVTPMVTKTPTATATPELTATETP